ncbi:MAG: type II secretion system protein, partial [Prevotella sp.]|nr:type II secretion system protein [Prevotella sp.]
MKRLKAFTLIELIVAMAVIGILMTGIVRMVEPMSATAANSAVLNNQRNVENAICNYLGENLRYASNLVIVKGGTPDNAITKFTQMGPSDKWGKQIDYTVAANKNKIHLIAFDCKT